MSLTLPLNRRGFTTGLAMTALIRPSFAEESLPLVNVTRDPGCGCCGNWAAHLKTAGFAVEIRESPAMNQVKARLGVPRALAACHTAEVAGYVIEGHVPAHAIKRLLKERLEVRGLAVPGMPAGSPGMEVDGMEPEVYDVIAFGEAGQSVFARYRGAVLI